MDERTAYGIYQKHRDNGQLTGLLNGPFGFLYDEVEAHIVATRLYGEDGCCHPTNPDHFQAWGYGKGSEHSPKPFARTMVGSSIVDLVHGEHPHSRSDNSIYARWQDGRIEGFNGHRLLTTILFQDNNYLKTSGLSGNQVRKGGLCTITINGFSCAKFGYRDIDWALFEAYSTLQKIKDFTIQLWDEDERKKLVGRKVYYDSHPAVIRYLFEEDMDVILDADPPPFPFRAYQQEDLKNGEDADSDDRNTVKDTIFSSHIWWWRK